MSICTLGLKFDQMKIENLLLLMFARSYCLVEGYMTFSVELSVGRLLVLCLVRNSWGTPSGS